MTLAISLIVPLYNEENGITTLKQRLSILQESLRPKYELECVLVDDGSKDGTVRAVRNAFASFGKVRIVEHGHNRGAGAAMRTGFQQATGEILCTIDADCTFDPMEIPKLLE